MASHQESNIPGPNVAGAAAGGGRDKRRSFLPAPRRPAGIPAPSSSSSSQIPPTPVTHSPSAARKAASASPRTEAHREEAPAVVKEVIPGAEKLVVGQRILISGVKPGTLRYVGRTHIAPGFWCGIELFDASGLHDGEVDGTRYFTCRPFRGIFAPVDKVVPDGTRPNLAVGEQPSQQWQQVKTEEQYSAGCSEKQNTSDYDSGRYETSGRSQIARLSGIPRVGGAGNQERGLSKSFSGDALKEKGSKATSFNRRSYGGQEIEGGNNSSTCGADDHQITRSVPSAEEADMDACSSQDYSRSVKKQLLSDSRQYLNITFGRDTPPPVFPQGNLPDLVSSTSPSSSRETLFGAFSSSPKDTHENGVDDGQGLMEQGTESEEFEELERSFADIETEVTGTDREKAKIVDVNRFKDREANAASCSSEEETPRWAESRSSAAKDGLAKRSPKSDDSKRSPRRKNSVENAVRSTGARSDKKHQDDRSHEVSPEVSEVLEWDYDHDAFDGKLLGKCSDNMSSSTSESCSGESSTGVTAAGRSLTEKGVADMDNSATGVVQDFEDNDDGFENIDDFPLGMCREAKPLMTDSGISERGFQDSVSDRVSNRKSVEFDSKVSVVMASHEGVDVEHREIVVDANLQNDLKEGHRKQERPLSLLSTASADTGYVPDTDSDAGTLTANSPMDWAEKQLLTAGTKTDCRQRPPPVFGRAPNPPVTARGLPGDGVKGDVAQSDAAGLDGGKMLGQTAGLANVHPQANVEYGEEESDESEEEEEEEDEDEEEEDTSDEEGTSSEYDSEEESEEEDESEEEEEEEDNDQAEDERIEADRVTPSVSAASATATGDNNARVAAPDPNMAGSAVIGSEMTESTDVGVDSEKQGSKGSGDPKLAVETSSGKPDGKESSSTGGTTKQTLKKKKSVMNSAENKKIVAEHKKAVKKASSRLADYIKAPIPPPKPKEEKKADTKNKKTNTNKDKKTNKAAKGKKEDNADDKAKEEAKKERRKPRVKEEKPKVKRTVVKSKWGNIMSQIEANKDAVKVKPKAEIQSSLALYLSTPATPNSNKKETEGNNTAEPKEPPKPKPKLIRHPKPDFSNVKSKLNITPPPQLPRRDPSTNNNPNNLKNTTKPKEVTSRINTQRKPSVPKVGDKNQLPKQQSVDKGSAVSQGTGSCTNLSTTEAVDGGAPAPGSTSGDKARNAVSRAGSRLRNERAGGSTSAKSDSGATQRSVKSMNIRNVQKSEQHAGSESSERKSSVKSSITPAAPRKSSNTSVAVDRKASGEASPPQRVKSSSPKASPTPSKPAWGSGSGAASSRSPNGKQGPAQSNQSRLRGKATTTSLKSGQPPDVVSTTARGSRAQEVARLESLCESRTKELNYTKMQLRAGLQAFDAMACLLNYCTVELDAFSCPLTTARLRTAEDKLSEQQHNLDTLADQKKQLEQQVQEVSAAREAAVQDVARLQQEMKVAEAANQAAQQALKEEHAASVKTQQEQLTSQHHTTVQQLQKYGEKQVEHARNTQRRQISELTAEHQMATNQLKVAHLEEIQDICNKHEVQIEELHSQHRKKLEDITHRFENIKLSLTEKVQSLCVECDDLRVRAKNSEEALQRDADVKVQMALTPFLQLPKEIESLKTVIDMRTEEIQKLRRQNTDLVKQLEELPIAQEKVISLQQKVENLQAIINIKTDHEKQLHEKCQVLMRKYDRESRANKRLSMDYEQVVWRMSQSADFSGSTDNISPRQLSHSPGRIDQPGHTSSPVRSLSSSSHGEASTNGVVRRHRKISAGEEDSENRLRGRANTYSSDRPRHSRTPEHADSGRSSKKQRSLSKSGDYTELVGKSKGQHDESFSSGHESGDTAEFQSSLESSVILETARGLSFNINVLDNGHKDVLDGAPNHDDVFSEDTLISYDGASSGVASLTSEPTDSMDVTVVVDSQPAD